MVFETVRSNAGSLRISTDIEIVVALFKIDIWPVLDTKGVVRRAAFESMRTAIIMLRRVILRKREKIGEGVSILDEATSSIDGGTDVVMQKLIKEEREGWIVIFCCL